MKLIFNTLLNIVFLYTGIIYSQQNQLQLDKTSETHNIDGVINEKEWSNAKKIQLERTPEWKIDVLVSYDDQYMYMAFTNLKGVDKTRLNAEILIQTLVNENNWDDNCFWFHSSYSNCYSQGNYFNWEHCSKDPSGWKANTFPFKNDNNNMEFKISFSKLQINPPVPGMKLKVAFKLSSADESHTYWPHEADIQYPDTWGELIF